MKPVATLRLFVILGMIKKKMIAAKGIALQRLYVRQLNIEALIKKRNDKNSI